MQYKEVAGGICAPKGFAAAGVHCGIRANHSEKYDLALIKAEVRCAAAGVYTTNKVCGAPIKVDRAHLADGYAQAIVVNSGNANTCAANGVALAEECCELVGKALDIDAMDVLPASTGVIGQPMVIDPFARGIPAAEQRIVPPGQRRKDRDPRRRHRQHDPVGPVCSAAQVAEAPDHRGGKSHIRGVELQDRGGRRPHGAKCDTRQHHHVGREVPQPA